MVAPPAGLHQRRALNLPCSIRTLIACTALWAPFILSRAPAWASSLSVHMLVMQVVSNNAVPCTHHTSGQLLQVVQGIPEAGRQGLQLAVPGDGRQEGGAQQVPLVQPQHSRLPVPE